MGLGGKRLGAIGAGAGAGAGAGSRLALQDTAWPPMKEEMDRWDAMVREMNQVLQVQIGPMARVERGECPTLHLRAGLTELQETDCRKQQSGCSGPSSMKNM